MASYLAIAVILLAVVEAFLLWHGGKETNNIKLCDRAHWLFSITVVAQNSGPQIAALEAFGNGGNPTYVNVDSCTIQGSTNLTCSTMNLVVDPANGVSLRTVNYGLCLCGSAVAAVYNLSDGTEMIHSCQQCPFDVRIGQLQIRHNVKVFVNDSGNTNTTIIRLSVSVCTCIILYKCMHKIVWYQWGIGSLDHMQALFPAFFNVAHWKDHA